MLCLTCVKCWVCSEPADKSCTWRLTQLQDLSQALVLDTVLDAQYLSGEMQMLPAVQQ